MTDTEIIESNKLIAVFIGGEVREAWKTPMGTHYIWTGECVKEWRRSVGFPIVETMKEMHILDEQLEFNSSWEWLMPVVEKISRIEFDRKTDEVSGETVIWTHHPVTFGMLNNETGNPMVRFYCSPVFEAETLIEATYLAVVDFIKSTNEQQSQHR